MSATQAFLKRVSKVKADVAIDKNRLDHCMTQQPSLYLMYATIYVQALQEQKRHKITLEKRESFIHQLMSEAHSRVTEKMLAAQCWKDAEWKDARSKLDDANICVALGEQICRAFEHRRDMLVNVGASVREELRSLSTNTRKQ